jgi:Spy/CpxP family protein refolding chaperone
MLMDSKAKGKWQVRAAVAVIFIIGFVAGALVMNIYRSKQASSGSGRMWSQYDQMLDQLNLAPDQKSQVEAIFNDARSQLMEIRRDSEPRFREVRQQTDSRLQAVLTREQWEQFQQMVSELKNRSRHGRGHRDKDRK